MNESRRARIIAFYLPQYHPIPENDAWWGRGFTEWTNVAKATPLFAGHTQPRLPADLGFYDLRVPEVRESQAELARVHGVEGFCYWHYWFAGKRLLERPFLEVLRSGRPSLPFCLGWANDSWSGIWHGCPDQLLMEQTYPGEDDDRAHFEFVREAFSDPRYICVDGKPLFLIYKPYQLREPERFIGRWQKWAVEAGLPGVYFVAHVNSLNWEAAAKGFDAVVPHNPGVTTWFHFHPNPGSPDPSPLVRGRQPDIMEYADYARHALPPLPTDIDSFPCALPNWDNTPRCGRAGMVLTGSTPQLFEAHLNAAIDQVRDRVPDKRIVFVKSWNEWAEGNYLEPDAEFGQAYLEACRRAVCR